MRPLRTFAAVFALACAVVAVAWWMGRAGESGTPSAASPAAQSAVAPPAGLAHEALAPVAVEERRELAELGGACRLFGEVVDENGRPLAGVAVRLDVADPALVRETRTGADGRYELSTPLPSQGPCKLTFSAGPLRSVAERRLGRNKSKGSLRAGDNDLGRTVLEAACAIEGRVTLRGAPVPHLELRAVDERKVARAKTRASDDGSYRFASLALGKYDVVASYAQKHVTNVLATVDVASSETRRADLVFPWASFVAGRVVDARGAPGANAVVVAQRANDTSVSPTLNSADEHGRFCVPLWTIEPHRLQASEPDRRPEFELATTTVFAAGEANVVLAISEMPRARFRVVDAESGAPIERFGLRLARPARGDGHGIPTTSIRNEEHPGGECDAEVEADRCVVQVSAPGYESRELRLDRDPLIDGVHVIELSRAGSVVGRVTLAGKEVAFSKARLEVTAPVSDGAESQRARDSRSTFVSGPLTDLCDVHGQFRFDDLAPGDYTLTLRGESGARAPVRELRIERGELLDLGEIELAPGATLRGTALLPPRVDPKRVRVIATVGRTTRGAKIDASGRFEIDDLPAGSCVLSAPEIEGAIVGGAELAIELAAGAEHEVTFDLRGCEGMWLVVHVHAGKSAIPDAQVSCTPHTELPEGAETVSWETDENGDARLWMARSERVTVAVTSLERLPLGSYDGAVSFDANGDARLELAIDVGGIAVDWRALALGSDVDTLSFGIDMTGDSYLTLSLDDRALPRTHVTAATTLREALDRQRVEFPTVAVGSHEIWLTARRADGSVAAKFKRRVDVGAGDTVECAFTTADRVP